VVKDMTVDRELLIGRIDTALSGRSVEPKLIPTNEGYGKFAIMTVTKTFPLRTPLDGDNAWIVGETRLNSNGNVTTKSGRVAAKSEF
jgi:hypothetical protein